MSDNYVIRETSKAEIVKVVEFLKEHQEKEDVITRAFAKKHANITNQVIKASTEEFVSRYTNLIAIDDERIVGIVVLFPASDDLEDSKFRGRSKELNDAIIKIYYDSGLYNQFSPTRLLKIRKLAVHRDYRGKGLAKKLLKASVDWAEKNNYDVAFSLFSTVAAKKAAESVGFVKFLDYDLRQLKDSKGERLLADCSPNNVITLMTKTIR